MKRTFSFILKISSLLMLLWGGVHFFACDVAWNSSSKNQTSSSEQKNVWQGNESFDDEKWEKNVHVIKENFADVSSGSEIILYVSEIPGAEYHAIKIYENSWGEWGFLSSGNVSGATLSGNGNDASFTPTAEKIVYTLTQSDAEKLKVDGHSK